MMKICLFLLAATCCAQTITSPSGNPTWSGWQNQPLSVGSLPAGTSRVCYQIDINHVTNPGYGDMGNATPQGSLYYDGCSNIAPYTFQFNPRWVRNGAHTVTATAYNALGAAVGTPATASFTISDNWPVPCSPTAVVTPSTSFSSNWSGIVTISIVTTGCSGDSFTYEWGIDGFLYNRNNQGNTSSTPINIDTTRFLNGTHVFSVSVYDNTTGHYQAYSESPAANLADNFSTNITISNTSPVVGAQVWASAREFNLTPSTGTYTLGCTIVNTDGTTASSPTCDFVSFNTSCATVSPATGSSTTVTAVSSTPCSDQILIMGETVSETDGTNADSYAGYLTSASYSFSEEYNTNGLVRLTGGNCTTGIYGASGYNSNGNWIGTISPPGSTTGALVVTGSGCHFTTGPTRVVYALVNSSTSIPNFTTAGTLVQNYSASPQSTVLLSAFQSEPDLESSRSTQYLTAFCNSGFSNFEIGGAQNVSGSGNGIVAWDGSQTYSQFNAALTFDNNYLAALVNACPRMKYLGTLDGFYPPSYDPVQGPTTQSTWTSGSGGLTGLGVYAKNLSTSGLYSGLILHDEAPGDVGVYPLQGPLTVTNTATVQDWFIGISASSGTCTVTTGNLGPGASYSVQFGKMIITGSGGSADPSGLLNTALGSTTSVSSQDSTHFTFSCSSSLSGNYNASNDPGLTIQPLGGLGWNSTNTEPVNYDALAQFYCQMNQGAHVPMAASIGAQTTMAATKEWTGNGIQSLTACGTTVSAVSDWTDIDPVNASGASFNIAQDRLNYLIADTFGSDNGPTGPLLRWNYGSGYNPNKPLTSLSDGTVHNYALDNTTPLTITSCQGDVITFASPHGVKVAISSLTRMYGTNICGQSGTIQLDIDAVLNSTQVEVSLASFSVGNATDTTGTLTFQDGSTLSSIGGGGLSVINTAAASDIIIGSGGGGRSFTYSGSANNAVNTKRGQKFTISGATGTNASYFNNTTFRYLADNPATATDGHGSASNANNTFRELPNYSCSSSCGSGYIIYDELFVMGRNQVSDGSTNPEASFAQVMEIMFNRAWGTRMYTEWADPQAFVYQGSGSATSPPQVTCCWTGGSTGSPSLYNFSTAFTAQLWQHFSHPLVESGFAVPNWHAISFAGMLWRGWMQFVYQPWQNTPDYGPAIDCMARAGTPGDIMVCGNFTNGPVTRTFNLSPYLQSGQQIIKQVAKWDEAIITSLSAGTSSDTVTLLPGQTVWYIFPATYSGTLKFPTMSVRLADGPTGTTGWAVRYGYDSYTLDGPNDNVVDCGSAATCAVPMDLNIGTAGAHFYRIIYYGSGHQVLAAGDVQTL
jgi:hypothetical protein